MNEPTLDDQNPEEESSQSTEDGNSSSESSEEHKLQPTEIIDILSAALNELDSQTTVEASPGSDANDDSNPTTEQGSETSSGTAGGNATPVTPELSSTADSQADYLPQPAEVVDLTTTTQENNNSQPAAEASSTANSAEQSSQLTDNSSASNPPQAQSSPQPAEIIDSMPSSPGGSSSESAAVASTSSAVPEISSQEPVDASMSQNSDGDSFLAPSFELYSNSTAPENDNLQPSEEYPSSTLPTQSSNLQNNMQLNVVSTPSDNTAELSNKKIALILSGGGARGAFEVGAEKYAREVKGYHWDIIAGVSVGAMNGVMLAMHRYRRLMEIWDTISNDQVYTGGFNLVSVIKILFGAKSFYGNEPLQKLMQHELGAGRIIDDLHIGTVSLVSGEYVQFTKESLELAKAILASTSIPVVWPSVDISDNYMGMVDGGVRNLSPVGDVIDLDPDEIVIINCGGEKPAVTPQAEANVLSIGLRALDIMENEIFINDMKEFLNINDLVKEAERQGCVLHHPKTGRAYKYFTCKVIEPDGELGEVLDFSQKSIQASLRMGVRRAREVLGRP